MPYFHKLSFGAFERKEMLNGQNLQNIDCPIQKPGFNARLKVFNKGKSTAKKVQARIEKISYWENGQEWERYYNPTSVKWSGEKEYNSVDIVPKSFFFLDKASSTIIVIVNVTTNGYIKL